MNLGTPQEMLYDERDYNEPLKDMKPKDRTNIMTAKEEAIELVGLYYKVDGNSIFNRITWGMAKKCALICVDRMLESLWRVGHSFCNNEIEHLKEVKREINKL